MMERMASLPGGIPAVLLVGGIALLVLALSRLRPARRDRDELLRARDALAAAGRFEEAARVCLRLGRLDDAQAFYLRAGQPARAAQVASRRGDHRLAGALYESAGSLHRASVAYASAGMIAKARELLREGQLSEAPTARYTAAERPRPIAPSSERPASPPAAPVGVFVCSTLPFGPGPATRGQPHAVGGVQRLSLHTSPSTPKATMPFAIDPARLAPEASAHEDSWIPLMRADRARRPSSRPPRPLHD